jgi:ADP-dependent NAD(P)H-hydrate dehydratase / NAD(P)H-hydrate epimerase
MYLVTADEMRQMDAMTINDIGIPGRVLMENAGRGAADFFIKEITEKCIDSNKIAVIAGSGNNGGDGFVIARLLYFKGFDVKVFLFSNPEKLKNEAKDNFNLLNILNIPVLILEDKNAFLKHKNLIEKSGIIIDSLLGTGLKYEVKDYFKKIIEFINSLNKYVFSVDIPSGLSSETGVAQGTCIKAVATATFGLAKVGQKVFPGAKFTGKLKVIDIGIPPLVLQKINPKQYLLTNEYISKNFLKKETDAHKGDNGHLLIIAGSRGKTGAAILSAKSAIRCGAGLVTIAIPESINSIIETNCIEAMTYPVNEKKGGFFAYSAFDEIKKLFKGKKCIAIGPGIGTDPDTAKLVFKIFEESELPIVADADALNCISENVQILKKRKAPLILTPHPREMARLIGKETKDVQKDRVKTARDFALEFNSHLVLKGAGTVVAHPDGEVFINSSGNSGMAAGGMGDVLTGIIASLMCQGYSEKKAANMGVYLHGAAADKIAEEKGMIGYTASDTIDFLYNL